MTHAYCLAMEMAVAHQQEHGWPADAVERSREEKRMWLLERGCAQAIAELGPPPWRETIREKGPRLWRALHDYARTWDGNLGAAREHLAQLRMQLPCGECRKHWDILIAEMPPDLAEELSRDDVQGTTKELAARFYAWTIAAHNAVNARLGKSLFTPDP